MVPHVLGVGYAYNEYEVTAGRWKEFEIEFDYADNIKQAAAMLSFKEYICVAICSDVIPQDDLDILRQKRAVPIIVVPPSYSEEQRYACVHFGAAQYLHTYNHPMVEMFSEKKYNGLDINCFTRTVTNDMGNKIHLTAKELLCPYAWLILHISAGQLKIGFRIRRNPQKSLLLLP